MKPKNLVVTGRPGSGKTTLLKEALLPFKDAAAGFLTEEIREDGVRAGFRIRSLDGKEGVFASKRLPGPPRLNKYGIDLAVLESVGTDAVKAALRNRKIAVIDEIGSMEVFSESFRRVVLEAFQGPGPVLATIRLGAQPFTDSVKKMPDTEVLELTAPRFAAVKARVREWLERAAQA